jgi:asparagine synthase (glutamine-hydrolysing)
VCGIAGIADPRGLRPDDPNLADVMLRTLQHRGPDDHFLRTEPGAVLGTRRLAIIDVVGGRQPLTNEDGSVVVTQNGEIYNYVELRDQLAARGHLLRSDGDTEVIPHLYEDYGDDFVDHLRGMFAIALWDVRRGRLVLARDRLGKKPLYWRLADGRLSWGSELKALLADPSLERTVDRRALALFLGYQYVPAPRSILNGVSKLPPASRLVWDGAQPRIERYWTPAYQPKIHRSLEEDRDACLEVLTDAVRIRLRSDVPLGSFLSGGMDSGVVTSLMARLSAEPVRTFSIGFDIPRLDETRYAQAMADHFSTRHTTEVVSLDVLGVLPDLAQAYDEPFGDPSAIPTFRVAQLAARDVKVVLTGDGGDEAFGGYRRYIIDDRLERLSAVPAAVSRAGSAGIDALLRLAAPSSRMRRRIRLIGEIAGMDSDRRYDRQMRTMSPELERALLNGQPAVTSSGYLSDSMAGAPTDRLDRLLWTDTLSYLPEDLLVKMDRATMANSLEARSPLLDQEVVEFAARLPRQRKLDRGRSKILLRQVARTLLPDELVERPKMGFSVPIAQWFRGELGERYRELALASDAFVRDVVDQSVASRLLDEHVAGSHDHGHRLWQLFMLEQWGRTWARLPVAVA